MKSNLTAVHLNHTNDVLRELLRFDRPADVILSRYFRENKKLGQKDRHEIAELTFTCLRHLEREADIGSSWDTLEVMVSLIPLSNHATGVTQMVLLGLAGMAQLADLSLML